MKQVGIIDYGAGNFQSVFNAVEHVGFKPHKIDANCDFDSYSHIILPGVGSYGDSMERIRKLGLLQPILDFILPGDKPFLGICVGAQILSSHGFEFGEHTGLNIIPGKAVLLQSERSDLLLPHMGWNPVHFVENSPLFSDIPNGSPFYFVHSYHVLPHDRTQVIAFSEYFGRVTACIQSRLTFGVQFHPEKSQSAGLKLLSNFCKL